MRIIVPDPCSVHALYGLLAQVFDENGSLRSNAYDLDFEGGSPDDPIARMGVAHLMMWLDAQGVPCRASGNAEFGPRDHAFHEEAPTDLHRPKEASLEYALPVQTLDVAESGVWLRDVLVAWLAEKLGVSPLAMLSFVRPFRSQVILPFASHPRFLISARCLPGRRFKLATTACGPDLPSAMRRILGKPVSDLVAMARATETCRSVEDPAYHQPASIQTLLQELVEGHLGTVTIRSGFVVFSYACEGGSLVKKFDLANAYFPGMLIESERDADFLATSATLNEPYEIAA